ncbi:MAG: serpin family protein [Hydrogenoanaerobacterium sp.]
MKRSIRLISLVCVAALLCAGTAPLKGENALGTPKIPKSISAEAVNKVNRYGDNLLKQLYNENKNVFISPANMYMAFGMLQNGAEKNTLLQLEAALGQKKEPCNLSSSELRQYLNGERKNTELQFQNSIWINKNIAPKIKASFTNSLIKNYNAKAELLDFKDSSAPKTINDWVKTNTNGLIEKIVADELDEQTKLFLISTTYFKSSWKDPFYPSNTKQRSFYAPSGDIEVPMMQRKGSYNYFENEQYQGVVLPYCDNKTAMIIILPRESLKVFSKAIDSGMLSSFIKKAEYREVDFSMPRLDINYSAELVPAMKSLGVTDAFNDRANLSGITGDCSLFVDNALHKTVLKLDEAGTMAAAATSIEVMAKAMPDSEQAAVMTVNRPFYLAIVDLDTELVLFDGTIVNPLLV